MLVAAHAGYAPEKQRSEIRKPVVGGYAAQYEPALTLYVLPEGKNYGEAQPYARHGDRQAYAIRQGPISIPYYSSPAVHSRKGVDAEALKLANLVWDLPSAGLPNPTSINVPQYHSTGYSAPAVVVSKGRYEGHANGASAAAATSNVAAHIPQPAVSYKAESHRSSY